MTNKWMFSPLETKVIVALGSKRVTIKTLTKRVYAEKWHKAPMHARNAVSEIIRRINKKCDYHQLDWWIDGQGSGRAGRTVWKRSLRD